MSQANDIQELSGEETQNGTNRKIGVNGTSEHRDSKVAASEDNSDLSKLSINGDHDAPEVMAVNKPDLANALGGTSNDPLSLDAVLSGTSQNGTGSAADSSFQSPADSGDDPLSATALISPLHTVDWGNALSGRSHIIHHGPPSIPSDVLQHAADWEIYKRAGPPYPPSLEKLIMNFHQKNSKSWQLAYDLGAGSGVYAPILAGYFRHVHVSDPDAAGLKVTRQLMSTWCKKEENRKRRGGFTFSVAQPEEAAECAADGTVDLAILTECAHFTDTETMVRSIAQTLAPGGTLAIVTHRPICTVVGNEQATKAVQTLFDFWGRRPWDIACGTEAKSQHQYSLGLDFVPLPEDLFSREKTRRITINSHGKRDAFQVPGLDEDKYTPDVDMDFITSRVDPKEKRIEYGENDEQGKGWRQVVGGESFRSRIALMENGDKEAQNRLESYFQDINRVVSATSPNGHNIVVEWAVAVILASKK